MAPLGPFDGARRVMVGVSGGADSMALAALLARWGAPLACIVDHGLRAGSAAEAAQAASRLATIGVPARVVQARLRPGPRVSERAREARYALLLAACSEAGCTDLLVAHHAQDQAETVRMRRDAGSGPAGLAGMAAIRYFDTARLLRPLLPIPPARLRATARAAGLAWAEDPTNQDCTFLRPRLRRSMAPADRDAALGQSALYGPARRAAEQARAAALADVSIFPEGYAYLPHPLGPEALSALVYTLSGKAHPPPSAPFEWRPRTWHGMALLRAGRLGPGWLLAREAGAVAPPMPAHAGARWDDRFVVARTAAPGVSIAALGAATPQFRRRSDLPAAILRGLPALWQGGDVLAIPHLAFPGRSACNIVLPLTTARPAAGAPFVPARAVPGDAHGAMSTHVVHKSYATQMGVAHETGSLGIR